MNANDLIRAFLKYSFEHKSHVTFAQRGKEQRGYIKVWGPKADPADKKQSHLNID